MAVETRYVVVRNEGQAIMTFTDKKSADEYDRMLDMAEQLSTLLEQSPLTLDDNAKEDLSIYLAKQREEVLYALQAKKRPGEKPAKKKKEVEQSPNLTEHTASEPNNSNNETLELVSESAATEPNEQPQTEHDFIIEKEDAA